MSVMNAEGICCGIRDEVFEYQKDGKIMQGETRTVAISDMNAHGDPVILDMPEKLLGKFQPYRAYKVPFEARAYLTRGGQAQNRYRVSPNAIIETLPMPGNGPAAGGNPAQAQPGK